MSAAAAANQVWENWQNKDDTIASTKGEEEREEEGKNLSLIVFRSAQIFADSGKSHLKLGSLN